MTLPCIMPTVMVMLLLAISGILNSGFDRIYMLQNPLNLLRSEVLDTYVYKVGIASDWLMIGVLTAFMLICLYPFWYVVAGSFNSGSDYMRGGVLFWPRRFSLENYQVVMVDSRLWIGFRVTIARTIVGTVFHLAFTSMVAYAMSRDDLPCRKGIYWYCMLTMFFGGGLIPFYLLLKTLGLLNSFWVYIIPGMFSVYNMIIISNYFRSVAEEIHESAVMDGASEFIIYSRLYLPVLATVTLWVGVGQWNSFFDTMVYTTDRNLQTLQLFLYKMIKTSEFTSKAEMGGLPAELVSNISTTTVRYATIVVSTIPILCIYPFLQRFLTKGIMLGSLKG